MTNNETARQSVIEDTIGAVEQVVLGLVEEPKYVEVEYSCGAVEHYIQHEVENNPVEGFTVLFAEREDILDLRHDASYIWADDAEELKEALEERLINCNELSDRYDYDKVVGYTFLDEVIEWI